MKRYVDLGKCERCGREFVLTYGTNHIYCSGACRQAAYRRRQWERERTRGRWTTTPV